MNLNIRNINENDFNEIYETTRDAFWNIYTEGCNEHLIIKNLRDSKEIINELSLVATVDDKIVGSIFYVKSNVETKNGIVEIVTFAPLSVVPEYQKQGIGKRLVKESSKIAKEMGYKGILIFGFPKHYNSSGFKNCKEFGITDEEGKYPTAMLVLELDENSLKDISGKAILPNIFETEKKNLVEFEKNFKTKIKARTENQIEFEKMLSSYE